MMARCPPHLLGLLDDALDLLHACGDLGLGGTITNNCAVLLGDLHLGSHAEDAAVNLEGQADKQMRWSTRT